MENKICGFIELNGELVKISSVEDLKALAARLGSAFTELTTQDYENLCKKLKGDFGADDCGVFYSKDGKKVLLAPITSNEYIIKSGTIAIASYAFNWHYYLYNGVLYTNKYSHEKNIAKHSATTSQSRTLLFLINWSISAKKLLVAAEKWWTSIFLLQLSILKQKLSMDAGMHLKG